MGAPPISDALAADLTTLPEILDDLCPDVGPADRAQWEGQLGAYARLLYHWSGRMSLLASSDRSAIVSKHILPAVLMRSAILARSHKTVADLGSGAGLPGVPLQITLPATKFYLIESRRRRANFLRAVIRQIGLSQTEVVNRRAEQWDEMPEGGVDVVVARAVASTGHALSLARPMVGACGVLLTTLDPQAVAHPGVPEPDAVFTWSCRDTTSHVALWDKALRGG